jgi:hypothetical protein
MINDGINDVPENTIAILGFTADKTFDTIQSLTGNIKRNWFDNNYYRCLPMVMANQLGFGFFSLHDFSVKWNGNAEATAITINGEKADLENTYGSSKQRIFSALGNGILTIQHDFLLKTPPGVNIYVTQPPNTFIPGLYTMSGLVESDNLTRDFTLTLKIAIPNIDIKINKGDMLASFIPVPRFFPDSFEVKDAIKLFDIDTLKKSITTLDEYVKADQELFNAGGLLNARTIKEKELSIYYRGVDPYGIPFKEHQKKPIK